MKSWTLVILYTASLLIISGCATKPTPKQESVIDETLPLVELTQDGTVADMNAVAFEWKAIDDVRVKGIYIYKLRSGVHSSVDEYYDTIDSKATTHYLDTKVNPDSQYRYYFKTFSDKAESKQGSFVTITTLPLLDSVSWLHAVENMPRSAKIIWRPHTNQKVKAYIVERKTLEEDKWKEIARVNGRLSAEYIDKNLEDNHVYKYRIRVTTYDNIISNPSEIKKVVTKQLPLEIHNIHASRDLPKRIRVTWDASTAKDFFKYYIYRSEKVNGQYEVVAKLSNNLFVDKIGEDGKQYFYRVSVMDKDGLQSPYESSSIQGATLAKPNAPVILEIKLYNNQILLSWNKIDSRNLRFIVSKRYKKGWFDEVVQEFKISGNIFADSNIESGITYHYKVFGVDKNSVQSEASMEVEIVSPELKIGTVPRNYEEEVKYTTPETPTPTPIKEVEEIMPVQDFN